MYIVGTWNFHESGHGKGVPDDVGATIKRVADGAVLRGSDITDAKSMYDVVQPSTTIKLYVIKESFCQSQIRLRSWSSIEYPHGTWHNADPSGHNRHAGENCLSQCQLLLCKRENV